MKNGQRVYVKRGKVYGKGKSVYEEGKIEKIYTHHILVKFEYENGNSFMESFFEYELKKKEELREDECIY